MTDERTYYDERCPTCGKYVPQLAEGYYDLPPGGKKDRDLPVVYCDENCAERKSPPAHYTE